MSQLNIFGRSAWGLGLMALAIGASAAPQTEMDLAAGDSTSPSFIAFESGPVRPMAMSADGQQLIVVNTPDNRIEIFPLDEQGALGTPVSVSVGMEPVAVSVNQRGQAWVVNHLSDSVSIVDLKAQPPRVIKTLLVGDEPRDIVFAGGRKERAFITTAHRGQHRENRTLRGVAGSGDPQLSTASVDRADVWVFDTARPGYQFGGRPEKIVTLFGDTPRALAVAPDGQTVYAAVFQSGNQTSVVHEGVVCDGFMDDGLGSFPCQVADGITSPQGLPDGGLPGGRPAPGVNAFGEFQPWTSMMVKYDRDLGQWRDELGRNFSNAIRFDLPDHDVFAINADTLRQTQDFEHVGTVLFNMAVNPVNGHVYVSNTDANNHVRFEGAGEFGGSTVQGAFAKAQITVIEPHTEAVKPRAINRHIDYNQLKATPETRQHSLATPLDMAVSSDGEWLYVSAYGSSRIGVFATEQLDNDHFWDGSGDEFDPRQASANYIDVSGGGPAGIVLNEANQVAYVATRFDNGISVIDLENGTEVEHIAMHNPEPESIVRGRAVLYDAQRTSSNGEASCAGCHIFGDQDSLAWDLGDPDLANKRNPIDINLEHTIEWDCIYDGPDSLGCLASQVLNGDGDGRTLGSMKGPMTTQTLKGLSNSGHMHWRGDRAVGYFGTHSGDEYDERLSFKNFIVAFEGLNGMDIALPENVDANNKPEAVMTLEQDIEHFTDFMLQVALPPNPIRGLDNTLSPLARKGSQFFHGARRSDGLAFDVSGQQDGFTCEGCHRLDPGQGFFGTDGNGGHTTENQITKTPQLRTAYTKVGMFGLPNRAGFLPSDTRQHQGEQIRGFGVLHDGATDTFFNFLKGAVFDNGESDDGGGTDINEGMVGIPDDATRRGLEQYMFEFDSDLAPIVGQQMTLTRYVNFDAYERLALLEQRAATPFVSKILGGNVRECELVAKVVVDGQERGWLYNPETRRYQPDSVKDHDIGRFAIRRMAFFRGQEVTFTCVPPGSGVRMALDRDLDGVLDGDESA